MQEQSLLIPEQFPPLEEPRPSVSFREVGEILRRRWIVLVATFLAVTAAGAVATKLTKPTYQATASLLVEGLSNTVTEIDSTNPLSQLLAPRPEQSVETQVRILESEQLHDKVKKTLGSLPEFSVSAVEKTNIVEVSAKGEDPVLVGKAPNVLLEAYLKQMKNDGESDVHRARGITEKGAEASKLRLEQAEEAMQQFKQAHKVPELNQTREAVLGEVEGLGTQYRETQSQLASVNAEIATLKTRLAATPETSQTTVSTETDPAIQETEKSIVLLQSRQAELSESYELTASKRGNQAELNTIFPDRYKGTARQVAEVDSQLAVLQKRLDQQRKTFKSRNEQFNPLRASLERALGDAQTRASSLSATAAVVSGGLASASSRLDSFPAWELSMARLERTLNDARREYAMYSQQSNELLLREQTQRTPSFILQSAKTPDAPVGPKRKQNMALSAALGLFFGVFFVMILEYFDDRINTKEEVDRLLHLPNLGTIPRIRGAVLLSDLPALSPVTDAYRGLRTSINFAALDDIPQTIAVTSSQRGEGKSVTVMNLATAMAMDGKRVIVVDADMRAPAQHKFHDAVAAPGLTDLLIGTHEISDVLQPISMNRQVHLISAGTIPPNPAELMGSTMMASFVEAVRELADVIIFDTPPTLAVSDAVLLSSRVDGVLFVVGSGETTRADAKQAVALLQRARARVLGVVLNKANGAGEVAYYGEPKPRRFQIGAIGSRRSTPSPEFLEVRGKQILNDRIQGARGEQFQRAFEERSRRAAAQTVRRSAAAAARETTRGKAAAEPEITLEMTVQAPEKENF